MSEIVLTTLNARYWHSSFGLRYLMANMGELTDQTVMLEFGINQNTVEILETIILHEPKIVGIGVYIWNIEEATKLVADLKNLRPEIIIVIGGPEVSYESETQEIVQLADYLVTGEADLALPELCKDL
ncbi:cobalamin B12-binding domain-containing protein, partial [bacterium]|nr:cobalamin B12-binding domain-containing protein [bacterium]